MQNKQENLNDAANASQATQAISESARVVDLNAPGIATQVSKRILADIDAYCVKTYDDGHRKHLGASLIGRECSRYLWYVFRWCMHKQFDGRMLRLFNRGHREEARFVEWLEGIGAKVWFENREGLMYHPESDSYWFSTGADTGPDAELSFAVTEQTENYKTHIARAKLQGIEFPQYRISACGGHFGGSLDGIAELPPHYGIKEPVLLEFKTNGTGAGFTNLTKDGMAVSKPEHYAQTSTYGNKYKFKYALYLNINKNDDSIHCEIVKLDWNLGAQMEMKAERIIIAQEPPPRLSNNSTFKTCAYCDFKPICHEGKPVEMNCRSCKHASPRDSKQWFCATYQSIIPEDQIPKGCGQHQSININA